jgi:hypothetical protein
MKKELRAELLLLDAAARCCLLLAAGCWLLPPLPLSLRVGARRTKSATFCWQEGCKTSHALKEAPAPAGW